MMYARERRPYDVMCDLEEQRWAMCINLLFGETFIPVRFKVVDALDMSAFTEWDAIEVMGDWDKFKLIAGRLEDDK